MRRLGLACLLGLCLTASARAAHAPNIILIVADDLGRNDLGCYGSTYYKTPHLDRLAKEGLKFTDAYAACPVCSPTRAALLTGKYPARLNLTDWLPGRADRPDQKLLRPVNQQQLPLEEVTLAEALKTAKYATASIGKWHLGGAGFEPTKQGFDLNVAGDQNGSPLSYFAPFKNKQGQFIPGLEKADEGEYLTERLTAEAEKFIENNKERPFFLYLPHYTVHIPLKARDEIVKKYRSGGAPGTQNNPIYAAMIESLDDSVGRIVKKLDELKLSDNTIVIFTSDNGGLCTLEGPNTPATTNAPFREGKGYLYEGGTRVALLMKWPGQIKLDSVNATPVSSIDLFPTLTQAADVKSAAVDGVSLMPLFTGGTLKREALYWHYPHYSNQGGKPGSSIRVGDYKLIEFLENERRELFNLKDDVRETRNLALDKPDVVKDLAARLESWRKEVGAKPMKANPDFVPNPQAKDGSITLHSRTADVFGTQLRYEPIPHKNTLGFWIRKDDWASWEFTVTTPGTFTVEILQGCGKGSGGSEVAFSVGDQTLKTIVEDTGGFQSFKARAIGTLKLEKAGRYTMTVKPQTKPGAAVMDLRQVTLKPEK